MAKYRFHAGNYIISEDKKRRFMLNEPAKEKRNYYYTVKAYDLWNDRDCFLKFIALGNENVGEGIINLTRESKFKFYYPYIEHVYELFKGIDPEGDRIIGVSVEFIKGGDLVKSRKQLQQRIEENEITEEQAERIIFRQIMQFLHGMNYYLNYAKPAYYHRDLKPENIMVTNGDIKIIDFDYSHISGSVDTLNTRGHNAPFSSGYTSPAVLEKRDRHQLAEEIDEIYSAGRVLFFWLTGKPYYEVEETFVPLEGDAKILEKPKYCLEKSIGYGFDESRLFRYDEKYKDKKYEKLVCILKRMCAEPESGQTYSSIGKVLAEMKKFLIEFCGNSNKAYEEFIGIYNMPFLPNNRNRNEEDAPMVAYKEINSLNGFIGHPLCEYTMRDIPKDGDTMLSLYNIEGEVYYVPSEGTTRINREEDSDYRVYDQDIFKNKNRKIEIHIR